MSDKLGTQKLTPEELERYIHLHNVKMVVPEQMTTEQEKEFRRLCAKVDND